MNHALVLPLVLPLLGGALLLALARRGLGTRRLVSGLTTGLSLLAALWLFAQAGEGRTQAYLIGDWPAPYGIVLVLDRLAALMLLLTAVLAAGALARAIQGADREGHNFHALFQFQLLGLNGAFLTGDLFNLFVFFEILLIASYGLLLHGGGPARARAGLHYVVLNLVGSALFLFAVGLIYGATGTLNLADLALAVQQLDADRAPLVRTSGLLLLVVFGLKAALPPLHFWLVPAYAAATAPVAALFAVMTKVGAYALLRLFTLVFGAEAGPLAGLAEPWLMGAALAAMALGTLGVLAANELRELTGYLVIVSVGTLLAGIAVASVAGIGGALYYLLHTTLVSAGLFLLADLIQRSRPQGCRLVPGARPAGAGLLGTLFLLAAVAVAGMPPLSGLIGKLLILQAVRPEPWAVWIWAAVLGSSLLLLMGLARAGGQLFWHGTPDPAIQPPGAAAYAPVVLLLSASPLLVALGGPVATYTEAVGRQLLEPRDYIGAVFGQEPRSAARAPELLR